MTETTTNFASKAIKLAGERTEKTRKILRRNRLAYLGLHGMAFDQAKSGMQKLRGERETLLQDMIAKGEDIEVGAVNLFKTTQSKAGNIAEQGRARVWNILPGATVNRVEELEAELEAAKAKLTEMSVKTKAKAKAKKTAAKKKTVKKVVASKPVPKTINAAPEKPATATTAPAAKPAAKTQPRHIPYFNDVKRYDPLANEDIVRKIVNHCGIALSSQDARYVACSDETERNRVRDSWLKKKLGVEGSDVDLDKKVQNVCSIMQRDNMKNRVTFYYLAAKAERKLGTL